MRCGEGGLGKSSMLSSLEEIELPELRDGVSDGVGDDNGRGDSNRTRDGGRTALLYAR